MTNEPKPCPFCGAKAERPTPDAPHGGMVQCVSCGASAFGSKWNRRVVYVSAGITAAFEDNRREIEALRSVICAGLRELDRSSRPSFAWQLRAKESLSALAPVEHVKLVPQEEADAAAIKEFSADLNCMSVDQMKRELAAITDTINSDTAWQEALSAALRRAS